MIFSDVAQTKNLYKMLFRYLHGDYLRPLSIILPKMSGSVKTFDETKLMSSHITKI